MSPPRTNIQLGRYLVLLLLIPYPMASSTLQRPQVRCESQLAAEYATNSINCAKSQYEETRQSIPAEEEVE